MVDAILNIDVSHGVNEEDLPRLAEEASMLSNIDALDDEYQYGILLAMQNQIELVPTGPLIKIRKKQPESKTSAYAPVEAKGKFSQIEYISTLFELNLYPENNLPMSLEKLGMALRHISS